MEIAVLGPLSVHGDPRRIGGRDRLVLAALTTAPGEAFSVDRLADILWGDRPPVSFAKNIQGCVSRLRGLLGADAIGTVPNGYRLTVPAGTLDSQRFEELLKQARVLVEDDWAAGRDRLESALGLWRGSAYPELEDWDRGRQEAARLEELRHDAEELLIEGELRDGHHREIVPRARAMVDAAPMREHRWAQLALALYRSHRQAEALEALRRLRALLSDQLGLDPGEEVVQLEAAILNHDADLKAAAVSASPRPRAPRTAPRIPGAPPGGRLAGRVEEVRVLGELLRRGINGSPGAVIVHGEAGVGKTRLVTEGADAARDLGYDVLWGRCTRFGAASWPYAPFAMALEAWLANASTTARADLLAEAPRLDSVLPSLVGAEGEESQRLLPEIARGLVRLATHGPVLLVIDDLQWADASSLDLLGYLIAGFEAQDLVVMATVRDEELDPSHRLHGWLADVRRFPGVRDLRLRRLTVVETEQQLTALLGARPSLTLLEAVQGRSLGNAYFTELLAQDLDMGTEALAAALPDVLADALLAAWRGLGQDAQEVARLLSVAGRPLTFDEYAVMAGLIALDSQTLSRCLVQATAVGVVTVDRDDRYWFRHPLLAEVLYDTFLPGQAAPLHAAIAGTLTTPSGSRAGEMRRWGDLALHHERAGAVDEAIHCSLAAAALAEQLRVFPEQLTHLRRVIELLPRAGEPTRRAVGDDVLLLTRAAEVAALTGDFDAAYDWLDRARMLVDRATHPLLASKILCLWWDAVFTSGHTSERPMVEIRLAVDLASAFPDSVEYVRALSLLSETESWRGLPAAAEHAEQALEAAVRCGTDLARAVALQAQTFAVFGSARAMYHESQRGDAERAHELALSIGDPALLGRTGWALTQFAQWPGETRRVARSAYGDVAAHGSPVPGAWIAIIAAGAALCEGDLTGARDSLREILAARLAKNAGVAARLLACVLACRLGRLDEADQHLHRAEELIPDFLSMVGVDGARACAEHLISHDRPERAGQMVLDHLHLDHGDPDTAADLLRLGAWAAADLASFDSSGTGSTGRGQRLLDRLLQEAELLPWDPFAAQPELRSLFEAESARCRRSDDEVDLWHTALDRCVSAHWGWEEAVASWRCAEATVRTGPSSQAAAMLERALQLARKMGAKRIERAVVALTPPDADQPATP